MDQLGKLKTLLTEAEKKDVQILAISNDTPDESRVMMTEISQAPGPMDYPLLEDKGHRVIDRYGLFNPAESKAGIPYPTVYILDREGKVAHRFLDEKSGTRATNEQIRGELKKLGAVK